MISVSFCDKDRVKLGLNCFNRGGGGCSGEREGMRFRPLPFKPELSSIAVPDHMWELALEMWLLR